MQKILLATLVCFCLFTSCDKKEEMMYAKVYFPLSSRANETTGLFLATFDYSKDTTFIVGAYCSGNLLPESDIHVKMGLASDSLVSAQAKHASLASYELLPASSYSADPQDLSCVIKKGTERGDVKITFHTSQLDPDKSYILPLQIESVSRYEIAPKYHTLFFGIQKKQ